MITFFLFCFSSNESKSIRGECWKILRSTPILPLWPNTKIYFGINILGRVENFSALPCAPFYLFQSMYCTTFTFIFLYRIKLKSVVSVWLLPFFFHWETWDRGEKKIYKEAGFLEKNEKKTQVIIITS